MGDSEISYYYFLCKWMLSDEYEAEKLPEFAIAFTKNRYEKYVKNLHELRSKLDQDIFTVCRDQLNEQMDYLIRKWETVLNTKSHVTPELAKEKIKSFKELIQINV